MVLILERTNVLSFFINIPILERDSGMKSYSNFIIEKKKGQAVASPAPGDPLDPKGRKKIDKKFSDPSNPPKVENPEAPKPQTVNQADVSKQAAKYRRAERIKGATGGKTTGSLSKGTLSFPGDRSGAYQRAKADLEARKGFSGSKSGGLKADEANPNVDRSVRQQRTVKQGIPDPFKSKTPAPADPFKGVTRAKPGKPSTPDPFKGAASVPPKPKKPGAPERPAMRQAISDIKAVRKRLGITKSSTPKPSTPKPPKTVPQTDANMYIRGQQEKGIRVDPDFVGAQGPKASGAKPEMVGGPTAPKGTGSKLFSRTRAKGDAIRDISKAKDADLDKALKNLINTGDVTKSKPSGPSSSIGFRQFSRKATELQKSLKASAAPKPPAVSKAPVTPKGVTGGLTAPKDGVKTSPGVGPKSYTKAERILQDMQRQMAQSGVDPESGRRLSNPERIRAMKVARNPRAVELAKPPKPTSGGGALTKFGASTRGTTGSSAIFGKRLGGPNQLMSRSKGKVTFRQPSRAGTPDKVASALTSARKGSQTLRGGASQVAQASRTKDMMQGMMKKAGGVGGRVLGAAGSAFDMYSSYKTYRKSGDDRLRAGLKSGFRTAAGWLGGALGSTVGSAIAPGAGTVGGGIAGYGAGTWLADKVLNTFKSPNQRNKKKKN